MLIKCMNQPPFLTLGFRHLNKILACSIYNSCTSVNRNSYHCNKLGHTINTQTKCMSLTIYGQSHYFITISSDRRYTTESKNGILPSANAFSQRSHTCGELTDQHVGQQVVLCGWIEFQRSGMFITLRDAYGTTQLLVPDHLENARSQFEAISAESVIAVTGTVCKRPPGAENVKMVTGRIEVIVNDLKVLNRSKKHLPFAIRDFNKAKEALRLKYRYLDLRFPIMQQNLRLRSSVLMKMRNYLCNCGFVDVETPTLFRRTPGGAQEFVVPTRLQGQFYSLVQSPQQFKQLLMVGGMDRYFQVARCYRDEGSRPDRQPEFTQLDIELSFTDRNGVIALVEGLLQESWPTNLGAIPPHFPRITYRDAMDKYGSDKPDTRIVYEIQNLTDELEFGRMSKLVKLDKPFDFTARALVIPKAAEHLTKAVKTKLEDLRKNRFPLTWMFMEKVTSNAEWEKSLNKYMSDSEISAIKSKLKLDSSDCLFMAVGAQDHVLPLLGNVRVDFIQYLATKGLKMHKASGFNFLWVIDFPLFLPGENPGSVEAAHHPFTAPYPEDVSLLKCDPLKIRGLHYDLVLNGCEVGGGSIRIHDPDMQTEVLRDVLGIETCTLQHLLDALSSGAPPHGGIALGIDRLISLMCNSNSIRDVIAFPKSVDGKDQMSGAPVHISEEEKKLYHIQTIESTDVQLDAVEINTVHGQ